MWYQELKILCVMVFMEQGTFDPTTEMLSRDNRTNPLTWEEMVYLIHVLLSHHNRLHV